MSNPKYRKNTFFSFFIEPTTSYYLRSLNDNYYRYLKDRYRFHTENTLNMGWFIVWLWALVVALKLLLIVIGVYYPSESGYQIAKSNIKLAFTNTSETISNKRLKYAITIDSIGQITTPNGLCNIETLRKECQQAKLELPNLIAYLAIDKNCKMGIVEDVIRVLKETNCNRIFFATLFK